MSEPLALHHGACHCGRVRFEVEARLDHVVECNCSICHARGVLWHGVRADRLRIVAGEDQLTLYQFGTRTARHWFCRHCGVHPFARPRLAPQHWVANVRCLAGVDLRALPVVSFDGRHWEAAARDFLAHAAARPA
jgi:hypothetical protein